MKNVIENAFNRFNELSEAICYWLGFQTSIGRKPFIHEASLRYPIADALTKSEISISQIKLEFVHPLFKGKRVDLTIFKNGSDVDINEMFEFKIAKYTTEKSSEHQRVFNDIVRLAYFNQKFKKDSYFIMCGSFDAFKQHFVGDQNKPSKPETPTEKVKLNPRGKNSNQWISKGIYKDWFKFEKSKEQIIKFDNSDKDWGLSIFKDKYPLNDKFKDDSIVKNTIEIKTTCMAITPFSSNRSHAAGIWKIEITNANN